MQVNPTSKLPSKIVVDSAEIPRTRKHRKKNWQCTFEGCSDPLKTRYNLYSHIWDTHLRKVLTETQPGVYEDVPYKNVTKKDVVKKLCEKYMTQLVSDKKKAQQDDADDGEDDEEQNEINNATVNNSNNSSNSVPPHPQVTMTNLLSPMGTTMQTIPQMQQMLPQMAQEQYTQYSAYQQQPMEQYNQFDSMQMGQFQYQMTPTNTTGVQNTVPIQQQMQQNLLQNSIPMLQQNVVQSGMQMPQSVIQNVIPMQQPLQQNPLQGVLPIQQPMMIEQNYQNSQDQTNSTAEQTNSMEVQPLSIPIQIGQGNDWDILVNSMEVQASNAQQILNNELQKGDFMRIYNISNTLHRLHIYGEVLAENGYFVRSDERTKCHIRPLSDCLESISQLVGKQYKYKNSPQMRLGFVAQEVKQVLPDLVHTDEQTGTLSVDVLGIIPFLVESLKQLNKEIGEIETPEDGNFGCLQERVSVALDLANEIRKKQKQDQIELEKCIEKAQEPIYMFSFGPAPVVLYIAAIMTMMCVILPFTYEDQYVIWGFFIFTTVGIYFSLVLKWRELWEMVRYRRIVWEWRTFHFITISIFLFLFLLCLTFSVVMGAASFQSAAGLTVAALTLVALLIFLHKIMNLSFCFVSTTLLGFLILGFGVLGIVYAVQPSFKCSINDEVSGILKFNSDNIIELKLPTKPFNCFEMKLSSSDIGDLQLVKDEMVNNRYMIEGVLNKQIDSVQLFYTCSKFITFHCGSFVIEPQQTQL
ncbi:hypothetical protein EIN_179130 [Entamoeba invadens IP1]|uniref:hypothetical protein n=1 Tax=Entamoeba invadens IP1 TaxID=370355 RepID=UPI0002C3D58E|nr:hypothetical protein EIN_179130 [Entamoeba invadens IP1]ELP93926.1 hypothetical protein EIN_179130 [Entamoeba invadens IP1]|eukprot:XP_004260697.1 hypothetical protein EIN_179130 [Entamoeba invadens IP1]